VAGRAQAISIAADGDAAIDAFIVNVTEIVLAQLLTHGRSVSG